MIETEVGTTLDALAQYRQVVMRRTSDVLARAVPPAARANEESIQALTGLLMMSIEELKVTEEELRQQNARLIERQADDDQRAHHYRELFLHVPAPALVTDTRATILEANRAAERLLRRDARYLERKPLAVLLDVKCRADFRTRLDRLSSSEEDRSCRLTLLRHGDTPIDVEAQVAIIPDLGLTHAGVLFWLFGNPIRHD